MESEATRPRSFSSARRFGAGLNVALGVAAFLALVVMVNYLAARHFRRWHWTSDARYELSAQTLRVLEALTNEVRVTVLFDREESLFGPVYGLLKEYSYACPRLTVEHVDYKRDPSRAQWVIGRYQLPTAEADLIIFDSNSRRRVVRSAELSDYDWTGALAQEREIRRVSFKGEPLFTAALAGLLDARPPAAYLLQGHGEHDPASDESLFGYSRFARLLRDKNISVAPLRLLGGNEIPEDCQLLVIAGPQAPIEATELEKIGKHLAQGGRLLALLSHYRSRGQPTGLERLLAGWGATLGENYAFDARNTVRGNDLVCTNFSGHPSVRMLQDKYMYLIFARSVWPPQSGTQSGDAPKVQTLFSTGPDGYTASELGAGGVPKVDPARDRRGAIPLAAAVEKGSIQGVSPDRASTRIVIVGESVFLANETIVKAANWDFASLAVNWLLDRPQFLAGIAPRPIREYRITLTRTEMSHLRRVLLGGLPGSVLLLGLLVWMRRRA